MSEIKKRFDFSKLKDLGSIDIKDLFSKNNGSSEKTSTKKTKAKVEKSRNVIAFDMGTSSIKVVEGKFYKEKLSINKLIEIPTPEGVIADGEILNTQMLQDAISFALKRE